MIKPSCIACQFFQPDPKAKGMGECRRFAPRSARYEADNGDEFILTRWPIVFHDDFCGEHFPTITFVNPEEANQNGKHNVD